MQTPTTASKVELLTAGGIELVVERELVQRCQQRTGKSGTRWMVMRVWAVTFPLPGEARRRPACCPW